MRPNSGRIEPSSAVEIQVLLQTMKEDPPLDVRCKDKFLVQSVTIPSNTPDGQTVSQIWAGIESVSKSSIQEKKIRVVFLPADGQPQAQANGIAAANASSLDNSHYSEDQPPAYSSPSPQAVTPQRSVGPTNSLDEKPEGAKNRADAVHSAHNPATQSSSLAGAASSISSAIPTSQEDLRRQLDDAKATISRLQEQAGAGLRQRNVGGSGSAGEKSGSSGLAAKPASAGGVPVQIVAALCLLCFLIAYFFF